jgi:hypothetical protein
MPKNLVGTKETWLVEDVDEITINLKKFVFVNLLSLRHVSLLQRKHDANNH